MIDNNFWKNKRVLITGHSGFKGSWLTFWLNELGATICGISLKPQTNPNLFTALRISESIENHFFDIRDRHQLDQTVRNFNPEVVFHLAAQPFVRESYKNPLDTYEINVIGTGNLLWSLKESKDLRSIVVVTTDKCYENMEQDQGYVETDTLGGFDPYSSSKACTEILTASFRQSFFAPSRARVGLATARAGNAIGGGDWSSDRIIPDAVRCAKEQLALEIRNPDATRPWQHVLVPLSGYLVLAQKLWVDPVRYSEPFNFAPSDSDCIPVRELLKRFEKSLGEKIYWTADTREHVHEAHFLKLDAAKAHHLLDWKPQWNLDQALKASAVWYSSFYLDATQIPELTRRQIEEFSNPKRSC